MHYTWVRFDEDAGDRRYVQLKSCDSFPAAEAFVKSSPVPLATHLTAKKWFAIAVKGTYVEEEAKDVSNALKEHGLIAKDSIVTLGNTYVRRVCCQWLRLVPIAFAMLAWCYSCVIASPRSKSSGRIFYSMIQNVSELVRLVFTRWPYDFSIRLR